MIKDLYSISDFVKTDDGFECAVYLAESHPIYEGHFPGMPVVPGVCILAMVKQSVSEFFNKSLSYESIPECKFLMPVLPNQDRKLKISIRFFQKTQDDNYTCRCQVSAENLKAKLKATFIEQKEK